MGIWTPVEAPGSRRWRSWGLDLLVVLGAAVFASTYVFNVAPVPVWAAASLAAALILPLLGRRIWPVPVFAWDLTLAAATGWWAEQLVWSPALVIALYTVAGLRPRRDALIAAAALAIAVVVGTARAATTRGAWFGSSASLLAVVLAATVLGLYVATRRTLLTELRSRAARLEHERDQQGELAAAAERARIAREMHDIVAHHLTVMVALADGATAQATRSPEQAAEAMRTVSATGRLALSDTRRLLGVLRERGAGDAARSPLPELDELDDLVGRVRAAGLPVHYEVDGPAPVVPPGVQLTLYRLVQEALTNTMKHGGVGARASVRVHYANDEVLIDVEDDGIGAGRTAAPTGTGRGLAGMRERVTAFGGEVQTGPRAPRGWHVSARLRLDEVDVR